MSARARCRRAWLAGLLAVAVVAPSADLLAGEPASPPGGSAYFGVYAKSNRNVLDAENVYPGITVSKVVENSPAEAAGLRVGDVLLEGGGRQLSHPDRLADLLDATAPGERVVFEVERDAERIEVALVAVERLSPPDPALPSDDASAASTVRVERKRLGIEFREADPARLSALGLSTRFGVELVRLAERSPLRAAGAREGDILYAVDGEAIPGTEELLAFLDDLDPGQPISLTLYDDGAARQVEVAAFRPGLRLKKLRIPIVFSLERGPDRSEYAALLGALRWTRFENGSNIRLLWLFEIETGSSEELLEVGGG